LTYWAFLAYITHIIEVLSSAACNALTVVPVRKVGRTYTSVRSFIKYLVA